MTETYFSIDVETDGPIPGPHSMLSFGVAVFTPMQVHGQVNGDYKLTGTFSRNLETLPGATMHPLTKSEFWDKNPQAWAECRKDLVSPKQAIGEFLDWVKATTIGKSVCVGYPATFDFMFLYWYIISMGYESPFSFSALDIKSYMAGYKAMPFRECTKRKMPRHWFPKQKHTHVAVDDAIEQGELFINILRENRAQSTRVRS